MWSTSDFRRQAGRTQCRQCAQLWESTVALPRGATELERVADVMGNPVLDERQVCAVAYQGRVACFDRRNGSPLWARDTPATAGWRWTSAMSTSPTTRMP